MFFPRTMPHNEPGTTTAFQMDDSKSQQEAASCARERNPTSNSHQADQRTAQQTASSAHLLERQRENLVYSEDLVFLPRRKDPRYTFYRHPKNQKFYVKNEDVLQTISDPALEYKQTPYFGGVLDIRRDNKQYKNKVYEMGTRAYLVTELYRHIPRSCRLFNRWCLVYYTGQPYSVRKKPTQQDNDKNDEETMPSCDAGSNSENGNSDVESSLSFVTVEEKDTSFSLKQNIEREDDEPTNKKQKPDKANCSDMDLMIKQLTAVSREFEEHEFRSIVDVLGEDRSAQIDGVIGSMNCLVKTACKLNNILSKHLVF